MTQKVKSDFVLKRWTKSIFLGWLLGVILIITLSSFLDSIGIQNMQFYLGIGMGTGVGLVQWVALRKIVALNVNWVWLSALGMGIPFVVLDLLLSGTNMYKPLFGISLGSLTLGLMQYSILKKYSKKAYLWIFGCFAGWTLAVSTVFMINFTMRLANILSSNLVLAFINLSLILAGGIVLGLVTGITLKKMLE